MNIVQANLKYIKPLTPLDLNNVLYMVIHHADASVASADDIHAWHLQNGWSGAGYNEYIRKDGTVYIMRGDNVGAHTKDMNGVAYGICCEGAYNKETMPEAQLLSLVERIRFNMKRFPKLKEVVGHKYFGGGTECPGTNFPLETAINKAKTPVHWASNSLDNLRQNGIIIKEERFDDKITRGEIFVLLSQIVNKIVNK